MLLPVVLSERRKMRKLEYSEWCQLHGRDIPDNEKYYHFILQRREDERRLQAYQEDLSRCLMNSLTNHSGAHSTMTKTISLDLSLSQDIVAVVEQEDMSIQEFVQEYLNKRFTNKPDLLKNVVREIKENASVATDGGTRSS